MTDDPFVRRPQDPGPLVPGKIHRFRWTEPGDADVRYVRERVQEGGPGLYVLRTPFGDDTCKVLVEAYYPEDMKPRYASTQLDPIRFADMRLGRLVVVHVFGTFASEHDLRRMIDQTRKNNRAARDYFERGSAKSRKNQMRELEEQDEDKLVEDYYEHYIEAAKDTRKILKPHVSLHGA